MDYIQNNKAAWEEAFEHRKPGWGENNHERLLGEHLPFFCADVARELEAVDWSSRAVAQFCCNNGRELLSLLRLGAASGTGFDIAENILAQAAETAKKAGVGNCRFVACNILDIPETFHSSFDFVFFTIGAITWFRDLGPLFQKAADCLKPGGRFLLHDFHPFMNMLPMPGGAAFAPGAPRRVALLLFPPGAPGSKTRGWVTCRSGTPPKPSPAFRTRWPTSSARSARRGCASKSCGSSITTSADRRLRREGAAPLLPAHRRKGPREVSFPRWKKPRPGTRGGAFCHLTSLSSSAAISSIFSSAAPFSHASRTHPSRCARSTSRLARPRIDSAAMIWLDTSMQ